MLYRRQVYNETWVRCPQGDIPLGGCRECHYFKEIRRRKVYCSYKAGTGEKEE